MDVLVVGGNGYIGQAAIRALAKAGHRARGLVRSPAKGDAVRAADGLPVVGDIMDPVSLTAALRGTDAAIHLAIASPASGSQEQQAAQVQAVRVQGSRNLIAAARNQGVRRVVVGSGYWVHGGQPGKITEETPLTAVGPPFNREAERVVLDAWEEGDVEGIVARPGMIYGDGSWFKPMVESIRSGTYRYVGDGSNHWSPVDLGDTGEAYRILLEKGEPGEAYLVVDDTPVTVRAYTSYIADLVGGPTPRGVDLATATRQMGPMAAILAANQAASNAKLRSLGWVPRYRTHREGLPDLFRRMGLLRA